MVRGVAVRARLAAVILHGSLAARRRPRARVCSLLAVVVFLGTACSPGVANQADGEQRAAEAKHATKQLEQAEHQDLGCNNVVTSRDKRVTTPPKDMVLLTDADAVAEPCWDRITFTFVPTGANVPPGYTIEYRDPPFVEGDEGQYTVETLGNAFLYITFAPASQTELTSGKPRSTYPGNIRLRLDEMHHAELVRKLIDNPDGSQSWLIGLNEKRPFTVDGVADSANHESRVSVYVLR